MADDQENQDASGSLEYANTDEFEDFDEVDSETVELPDDSFDEAAADFDSEGDDN